MLAFNTRPVKGVGYYRRLLLPHERGCKRAMDAGSAVIVYSSRFLLACGRPTQRGLTSELSGDEPAAQLMGSPGRRAGEVCSNDKLGRLIFG